MVDPSNYKNKCPYPMVPSRIVVHNTANDASAENEVKYMIRNAAKTSFHYAVDDKEIVQGIEENRNAYHAGDGGSGKGNREGIGIEICYSKSGGERFEKAEKNAAEFCAHLLTKYGWGIEKITTHQSYSGKYCPHRTLDMGWERFLNMVKMHLIAKFTDLPSTHWAFESVMDLRIKGIINGYPNGTFVPEKNVTRAETVVMSMKALKYCGTKYNYTYTDKVFSDIAQSNWAYTHVTAAYNMGKVNGTGVRKFSPDRKITRFEVAVIVRNAMNYLIGKPSIAHNKTMLDVAKDHWAYYHVNDLYNMGVINGYEDGTFDGERLISRAEVATMIRNMLRYIGK